MDYINLLHASGMYEKQTAKIIPFRSIDIFENAVSAGTGNFLVDGPKETVPVSYTHLDVYKRQDYIPCIATYYTIRKSSSKIISAF